MVMATAGFCSQELLEKERKIKLNQTVNAIVNADTEALRSIMSSEYQTMSKAEATLILKRITLSWGDLTQLKRVDESKLEKPFSKGNMVPIIHWGTQPTHHGRWILFRSSKRKNHYLRIGLLFGKGVANSGQIIVVEMPVLQKVRPDSSQVESVK